VDLGGHDEVVFVEAFDFVSLEDDAGVAPAEGDVGVVVFVFGEGADAIHEGERLGEVGEAEAPFDLGRPIVEAPARGLGEEPVGVFTGKRRDPAAAGDALFRRERHETVLPATGLSPFRGGPQDDFSRSARGWYGDRPRPRGTPQSTPTDTRGEGWGGNRSGTGSGR